MKDTPQLSVFKNIFYKGLVHNSSLFLGVIGGLITGGVILTLSGTNPFTAFQVMLKGSWGSAWGISQTIQKIIPLGIVGLGLAITFRSRIINIGGEGQILAGGVAGSLVALYLGDLPSVVLIPLMLMAGFTAGAAWAFVPAVLKAYYRVDEVITTLLLNYICFWLVDYLVRGPLTDPELPGVEQSPAFSASGRMPVIIPGLRINLGVVILLLVAVLVYLLLWRTRWGYEFRAIGINPEAARYGGINLVKNTLIAFLLSGALAGMAGIMELSAVHGRLISGFSPGYGFTALAVALLGRLNPIGILLSSILFATLAVGGDAMQYDLGVPTYLSMVIQAAVVIIMVCVEARIKRRNND